MKRKDEAGGAETAEPLIGEEVGGRSDELDVTDSEESVFSGLEDSGSESSEEDKDDDEEESSGQKTDKTTEHEDEYVQDSSDEEDIRNTVGNIPMEWYKDFPHIGYDLDGKKIFKPLKTKDQLEEFLDKMENPDYWRTVHDKKTGQDIKLTDDQVDLVERIQRGQFGDTKYDPYEPSVDFFTHETMIHPVTNRPADKRSFIPSLIEKEKG
ncbi:ribosome biogenesis protein BOP1 [Rana temporaria]|uniref:ribosome biogenesis protein BOP1 n=1 Tax=Rana temporaria TaxID=8407 RepID=UPI001AAC7205|nr:ribosome biogenesis protein BOP1 [Rana temporaria]